jgi:transportin-3
MATPTSVHVLAKEGDAKALTIALKSNDPKYEFCRINLGYSTHSIRGSSAADGDGMRPLHYAAWYGHPHCVSALLVAGADVNAHDHDGATPVHAGAIHGAIEA